MYHGENQLEVLEKADIIEEDKTKTQLYQTRISKLHKAG